MFNNIKSKIILFKIKHDLYTWDDFFMKGLELLAYAVLFAVFLAIIVAFIIFFVLYYK